MNAAYKALEKQIGVSKPALYGKLNGLEPKISQALVRTSHRELAPVVSELGLSAGQSTTGLPDTDSRWQSFELKALGYPRAALFVFCMAVIAFNILSTVKAALKAVHGVGKIEAGLSDFYVIEEVQGTFCGMMIALPTPLWQSFEPMPIKPFALALKEWAAAVDLKRFESSPRGPKKPKQKKKFDPKHPYVSTARLLKQNKNKRSS